MELAVPLSRFTSRVGGGSAFYVRPHITPMKTYIVHTTNGKTIKIRAHKFEASVDGLLFYFRVGEAIVAFATVANTFAVVESIAAGR